MTEDIFRFCTNYPEIIGKNREETAQELHSDHGELPKHQMG
jgi:hypothetical protein